MSNKRIILFASSAGLKTLDGYEQFTKNDFRNYIFYLFRQKIEKRGSEILLFSDGVRILKDDILLFWNYRAIYKPYLTSTKWEKHIILTEPPIIIPENYKNLYKYANFEKIFTYYDPIVDGQKIIKIFYPNHFPKEFSFKQYAEREGVVMIAGHKKSRIKGGVGKELYSKRIELIRWYETNYPESFRLYGRGWDRSFFTNRILRKLNKYQNLSRALHFKKFPSYRGGIENKYEVLSKAKYCICFENMTGFEGYITEKLFDCFYAGVVPIYYGLVNISEYIPKDCYILYSDFNSNEDLASFLNKISDEGYSSYQKAILNFLESQEANKFKDFTQAEIIVENILK